MYCILIICIDYLIHIIITYLKPITSRSEIQLIHIFCMR